MGVCFRCFLFARTGDPGPEKGGGFQPTPGGPARIPKKKPRLESMDLSGELKVRLIPLEVGIRGRPEARTEE